MSDLPQRQQMAKDIIKTQQLVGSAFKETRLEGCWFAIFLDKKSCLCLFCPTPTVYGKHMSTPGETPLYNVNRRPVPSSLTVK